MNPVTNFASLFLANGQLNLNFNFAVILHCSEICNGVKTSETGKQGEQAAANFLKSNGYDILCRNFKNDFGRRLGEIDIIAEDKNENEIVFVEVKTREFNKYKNTLPEENITYSKLRKLAKIASAYLHKNNLQDKNYRFDAVSVWLDFETHTAKIKHIQNISL